MNDSERLVALIWYWSLVCIPTLATSLPLSLAATSLFKRKANLFVMVIAWVPTLPLMSLFFDNYVDGDVAFFLVMPIFWPMVPQVVLLYAILPAAAIALATSVPITLVLSRRLRDNELPKPLVLAPSSKESLD